jgi:hypothetical protein
MAGPLKVYGIIEKVAIGPYRLRKGLRGATGSGLGRVGGVGRVLESTRVLESRRVVKSRGDELTNGLGDRIVEGGR